ncbi:MAG: hypothetical protein HQK77_08185 [Desulfobacterales bacterium]|nr:hypothetical protein [Desulfobacterales bacterium]
MVNNYVARFFWRMFFLCLTIVVGMMSNGWAITAKTDSWPQLDIWPGNNAVGDPTIVGNPLSISLWVDNGDIALSNLDIRSLRLWFDDLDVTAVITEASFNQFLIDENRCIVNFCDIILPEGMHTLTFQIGNIGSLVNRISRQMNIQSNRGFQVGFHMPPFEDGTEPQNDWSIELNRVNETFGRHHTLIGYFGSWANANNDYNSFDLFLNNQIIGLGAVPVVTWEPWRAGGGPEQPDYSLQNISDGAHDTYIRQYAKDAFTFGKPVILRMMHEFNGVYYPWSGYRNNNDPSLYIKAFRHIVDIFKQEWANNVEFVWSPNFSADSRVPAPSNNIEAYYPGDAYVDWIGVSGYNWGVDKQMQAQGWLTYPQLYDSEMFGNFLTSMKKNHPSKKILIAEIGSNEGDDTHLKSEWIREAYASIGSNPMIHGVVWFNNSAVHDASGLTADFRVIANQGDSNEPSGDVMKAYKLAMDPYIPPPPPKTYPVYRFSAKHSNHFFFSADESDKEYMSADANNWAYDGETFHVFITEIQNTMPVYRLRNDSFGGHYFTISEAEKDSLINGEQSIKWAFERVAWYAYPTPQEGTIALHKFRATINNAFFYTVDETEKAKFETSGSWVYEGIAFYVLPKS